MLYIFVSIYVFMTFKHMFSLNKKKTKKNKKKNIISVEQLGPGNQKDCFRLKDIMLASSAQLDACSTGDQEVAGSTPTGRQHSFVDIDHEIFLRSFSPIC